MGRQKAKKPVGASTSSNEQLTSTTDAQSNISKPFPHPLPGRSAAPLPIPSSPITGPPDTSSLPPFTPPKLQPSSVPISTANPSLPSNPIPGHNPELKEREYLNYLTAVIERIRVREAMPHQIDFMKRILRNRRPIIESLTARLEMPSMYDNLPEILQREMASPLPLSAVEPSGEESLENVAGMMCPGSGSSESQGKQRDIGKEGVAATQADITAPMQSRGATDSSPQSPIMAKLEDVVQEAETESMEQDQGRLAKAGREDASLEARSAHEISPGGKASPDMPTGPQESAVAGPPSPPLPHKPPPIRNGTALSASTSKATSPAPTTVPSATPTTSHKEPPPSQPRMRIRTTARSASYHIIASAAVPGAPQWEEDSVHVRDLHPLTPGSRLAAMAEGTHIMAKPKKPSKYPTEEALHKFLELLLSSASSDGGPDVPLHYNAARKPLTAIKRIVLSLTATGKVYEEITPDTAVFLHRPWNLTRRRLGPTNSVFASHKGFDELFTTGHNLTLMRVLGASANYVPIFGYKSTPERKMGVVSKIPPQSMRKWTSFIKRTFGLQFIPADCIDQGTPVPRVLACMNGFDPDLIDRAIAAAASLCPPWPSPQACLPTEILYLTGESRPLGAEYAATRGIQVIFTGHRNAELWGLYFLARRLKEGYPDVDISIVDEEEEEKRMEDEKRAADKAQARNRKAAAKMNENKTIETQKIEEQNK